MNRKPLASAAPLLSLLLLVSATCALTQERKPMHFTGLINDYSPSTVKMGPWEMHGQWSMDLREGWNTTTADLLVDMTMSDYGTSGVFDATQAGQNPHTHHIRLTNVSVTWNILGCPQFSPNPVTTGFQMTGTVSLLTGNGSPAPFEAIPPPSTLHVCVTGGTDVPYSNITLMFAGPATTHFGSQAIHGVVRKATDDSTGDRDHR
jgi:hypothetical protein